MEILKQIGLTKRESQVYVLLLRIGESPISDIIKSTKAHPQVIYRVIDSLINKGLVIKVHKKHKTYVSAENPKQLERIEEQRLYKLKQVIPNLAALQKTSKEAIIRIARGEESVKAMRIREIESLPKNGVLYIIGGAGDRFYKVMGDSYQESEHRRIKKKIRKKLIAFANLKSQLDKDEFLELSEFKFLPDEYPVESSTIISGNNVDIMIWAADPIIITIESEEVAESYKKYFYLLWHIAR